MKIFNIFKKSKVINVVDKEFKTIKNNIKMTSLPQIGEKIYFKDSQIYNVIDVIHYVDTHQTIWLIVQKQSEENLVKATLNVSL